MHKHGLGPPPRGLANVACAHRVHAVDAGGPKHAGAGETVRHRAIELARETGAGLILWDSDAGNRLLEDPLPTGWSADGEQEQFGDRLTVNDLEAAGRAPLARQVREARRAGVEAWGWLPSDRNADTLVDYAQRQGADTIVVGEDSDIRGDLEGRDVRVEVAPTP